MIKICKFTFVLIVFLFTSNITSAANTASLDLERDLPTAVSFADIDNGNLDLSSSFSLEAWVKIESEIPNDRWFSIIGKTRGGASPDRGYGLYLQGSPGEKKLVLEVHDNNNVIGSSAHEGLWEWVPDVWYHVAVTYDLTVGQAVFYVNGEFLANSTNGAVGSINDSGQKFHIGLLNDQINSGPYDGLIDEVRVWNIVRTQDQIHDNYLKEISDQPNLVGYWKFNNDLNDSSSHNQTLTDNNNSYSTDVPFGGEVVNPVPLVTQVDPQWAGEVYADGNASCGPDIKSCGCVLASMSMIAGYYDVETAVDGSTVNPSNMNTWLATNNGYVNGSVSWLKLLQYLGNNTGGVARSFFNFDKHNETSVSNIDTALAAAKPVMGYNLPQTGGHYFVLSNKDVDKYGVRDPNWFNTVTSDDVRNIPNLVMDYDNTITKANLFTHTETDEQLASALEIQLASPAELLLIDSEGRRTGYDPETGEFLEEIPNSTYEHETAYYADDTLPTGDLHINKRILVLSAFEDYYQLAVVGTDKGQYEMLVNTVNKNGKAADGRIIRSTREKVEHAYLINMQNGNIEQTLEDYASEQSWPKRLSKQVKHLSKKLIDSVFVSLPASLLELNEFGDSNKGHGNEIDGCDLGNPGKKKSCG